ncbi:MAG: hypothetical protein ACXVPD_05335, partial [Bacteroidia bacterium]
MYITTYSSASTVLVRQPAVTSTFVPISKSIAANSVDSIDLTSFLAQVENTPANTVLNKGFYISASASVSIVYAIKATNNKEWIGLKGQKAVGTDFYAPFQNLWRSTTLPAPRSISMIDIVATQNGTTLLITPRAKVIGHAINVTYSVGLNIGETYSCQDTTALAPTKLAGSIISSDKPVAVTVTS